MNTKQVMRLGYLVPQFPGQTHIFFWREIAELEKRGVDVHLLSTQPPPAGLIAHDWSLDAIERTTYLASKNPLDMLRAMPSQPWRSFIAQMRLEGKDVLRDIAICLPAATKLFNYARANKLDHIHVHSCARAALIAAMALEQRSGLTVASLRTILKVTGGVTSRVFIMIKSLAIEAIETGEERITDEAVQSWQPVWAKHAWTIPRQPMAEFG